MGRRDTLRKWFELACEAYDLASTPRPSLIDQQQINRRNLLNYSLDCKYMLSAQWVEIKENHGNKRADNLLDYLSGRPISSYSWKRRQEIQADKELLHDRIKKRRGD